MPTLIDKTKIFKRGTLPGSAFVNVEEGYLPEVVVKRVMEHTDCFVVIYQNPSNPSQICSFPARMCDANEKEKVYLFCIGEGRCYSRPNYPSAAFEEKQEMLKTADCWT
jgi:hypothetical protein